ncbi:AraC family transcriptional regulator [Actinomadura barringtoniae]|uniref:AraC family transcriptional regulator n=1 Tax=Actinomadura barringtoniae TaxID=1427535 RepID=A0A939T2W7_9ACTN|nr:AraC family transcriptional regulator [Actinomadura barringtoniae]
MREADGFVGVAARGAANVAANAAAGVAAGVAAGGPRGVASAALLTRLAAEHGMPAERCLHGTGLAPATLNDPEAEITADQELTLIANLVAGLGHVPALGLEAGRRYHPTTFGLLGLAAISSQTLGQAVTIGVRHFDLTFGFSPFVPERVPGALRAMIDDHAVRETHGEEVARFLAERDLAAVVTFIRDLAGPDAALDQVAFRHAEPPYADRYVEVLGVRPAFGQPATFGVVGTRTLSAPLPQADPATAALSLRHCERQSLDRARQRSLSDRIRLDLGRRLESGRGLATQAETAARLNMSERSLRRHLQAEGHSYSDLIDESAERAARRLLATGRTVESVAAMLGYSGTSSFTYAFKRWTGTTPGAYARATASLAGSTSPADSSSPATWRSAARFSSGGSGNSREANVPK